jgi:hypothetical protein
MVACTVAGVESNENGQISNRHSTAYWWLIGIFSCQGQKHRIIMDLKENTNFEQLE